MPPDYQVLGLWSVVTESQKWLFSSLPRSPDQLGPTMGKKGTAQHSETATTKQAFSCPIFSLKAS